MMRDALLALLDGSRSATAIRDDGRPGRIELPADDDARAAIVAAHLDGAPAVLDFRAAGGASWCERVRAAVLGAYCPAADGLARWAAVDLDAGGDDGHGSRGLRDPLAAARAIAERADAAGLGDGVLCARSRSGRGVHVWVVAPGPVPLADAVLALAALVASAARVADDDAATCGRHAFARADGTLARPGDVGAIELIPRSATRPVYGWPLTLPGAGAFAPRGGGVLVDPLAGSTPAPVVLSRVPRCDPAAWARWLHEARAELARRRTVRHDAPGRDRAARHWGDRRTPSLDRLDAPTRDFVAGRARPGARNVACYAAACSLLGVGVDDADAERLIVAGARACGLPEREARAALASARHTVARRQAVRR